MRVLPLKIDVVTRGTVELGYSTAERRHEVLVGGVVRDNDGLVGFLDDRAGCGEAWF